MAVVGNATPAVRDATGETTEDRLGVTDPWEVLTDNLADTWLTVRLAPGLPQVGQPNPIDPSLTVASVIPFTRNGLLWRIGVTSSSPQGPGGETNPLLLPTDIEFQGEPQVEPIDRDQDGGPIQNSARQSFDPPINESFYDLGMVFTKNFSTPPPNLRSYMNSVNNDTFFGNPPGTALMESVRGQRLKWSGQFYWRIAFPVKFREPQPVINQILGAGGTLQIGGPQRAWYRRIKDQGFDEFRDPPGSVPGPGVVPTWVPIEAQTSDGQIVKVSAPCPLDGGGRTCDPGIGPIWFEFRTKRWASFNALGLGV